MREEISWYRRRDALAVSFAVPVIVMIIIFIQRGIFPFGEQSYLRTDLYHQYAPFFSEFKMKLSEGRSLLYSWDVGLGVNFSAIYAYYLASPLNWLIFLCPKKYIIEFMTCMIVVKTALCGVSMTWYLQKRSRWTQHFYAAFFGIFYAMSAYLCAYSWNIMWLDCIILFPLVAYGLEKLVSEGRCGLYTVALGLCITSNYYISIMICMFLVIYFFALLVLEGAGGKQVLRGGLRFAVCSLIAGGISAAVLIPEVYALQSTASGHFDFPKTFTCFFSIMDMLARHIGNVTPEIGLDHWPNIYCGIAVFQLMQLYAVNRRISLREKSVYAFILIFFLASFSINVLNYIWHGFHYPNSLPARQSFIYIFLVLFLCYRGLDYEEGNTLRDLKISFLTSFVFILACQKFVTNEDIHFAVYYAAMLFLPLYSLILWKVRTGTLGRNRAMLLLLGLVTVEAAANVAATSVPTTSRTEYTADNEDIIALRNTVPELPFSRFEKIKRKSKDDGAWMNFHSVSLFSSTADKSLSDFMKHVGCESSVNAYSITGSTPFVDALLDVRYAFYPGECFNPALTEVAHSGEVWLYENPSTFDLGFAVQPDLFENWVLTMDNPADVQNDLCVLADVQPVLEEKSGTSNGKTFSFNAWDDGEYYAFATSGRVKKVKADLPGDSKTFDNLDRRFFMELGTLKDGDPVLLRDESENSGSTFDVRVYRFDYDALADLKKAIGERPFKITSFRDDHIEGTISTDQHSLLFFSIPYDKGWTVTVDGVKRETVKSLDAFLSVRITPGEHTVVLSFEPRGLKTGALITALSLLLLNITAGVILLRKIRKRRALQEDDEDYFEDEDSLFEDETHEKAGDEFPEKAGDEPAAAGEDLLKEGRPAGNLLTVDHPDEELPEAEDDTDFLTEEDPEAASPLTEEDPEETVTEEETE